MVKNVLKSDSDVTPDGGEYLFQICEKFSEYKTPGMDEVREEKISNNRCHLLKYIDVKM